MLLGNSFFPIALGLTVCPHNLLSLANVIASIMIYQNLCKLKSYHHHHHNHNQVTFMVGKGLTFPTIGKLHDHHSHNRRNFNGTNVKRTVQWFTKMDTPVSFFLKRSTVYSGFFLQYFSSYPSICR